jgi:hypothetical protein
MTLDSGGGRGRQSSRAHEGQGDESFPQSTISFVL